MAGVFSGTGAVLPEGDYELRSFLNSFVPSGSCSIGCDNVGSSIELSIIPEPTSALLLGAGLVGLAWRRRDSETNARID